MTSRIEMFPAFLSNASVVSDLCVWIFIYFCLAQPTFTIKLPRSTQRPLSGSILILNCLADAWPEPVLKWTINGTVLSKFDEGRVQILKNNSLK
jgi:hypothetical protein